MATTQHDLLHPTGKFWPLAAFCRGILASKGLLGQCQPGLMPTISLGQVHVDPQRRMEAEVEAAATEQSFSKLPLSLHVASLFYLSVIPLLLLNFWHKPTWAASIQCPSPHRDDQSSLLAVVNACTSARCVCGFLEACYAAETHVVAMQQN